jgi:hypothetical protein
MKIYSIILLILVTTSCTDNSLQQSEKEKSNLRIVMIDSQQGIQIWKDTKTGCEFLHSTYGYGESIVYLPNTCGL